MKYKHNEGGVLVDAILVSPHLAIDSGRWPDWFEDRFNRPSQNEGAVWRFNGEWHYVQDGKVFQVAHGEFLILTAREGLTSMEPDIFHEQFTRVGGK